MVDSGNEYLGAWSGGAGMGGRWGSVLAAHGSQSRETGGFRCVRTIVGKRSRRGLRNAAQTKHSVAEEEILLTSRRGTRRPSPDQHTPFSEVTALRDFEAI